MLDEREGEMVPAVRHRAFNRQGLGTRTAIVVAGPLFNFLFAVVAYWGILMVGETGTRPVICTPAEGSVAAKAGFQSGDEILAVGERPTPTWEAVLMAFMSGVLDEGDLPLEVRDGAGAKQTRWFSAHTLADLPEYPAVLSLIGLSPARPPLPPVIGALVPGEAAAAAGLRVGDRILRVEGEALDTWEAWVGWVRSHPERPLRVEIERGGMCSK